MRTLLRNDHRAGAWKTWGALVPVCLAPLVLVGYTLRPSLEAGRAERGLDAPRSSEAEAPGRSSATFDVEALVLAVEATGRTVGLEVERVAAGTVHEIVRDVDGAALVERTLVVEGRGAVVAIERLAEMLRAAGHPVRLRACRIDSFAAAAEASTFQFELGFVRRAEPDRGTR